MIIGFVITGTTAALMQSGVFSADAAAVIPATTRRLGRRGRLRATMRCLVVNDPDGGMIYLTTDSPASSHGVAVLEVRAGNFDGIYGPSDAMYEKGLGSMTAAALAKKWANSPDRADYEIEAARRFCAQWSDGPQVD